MTRRKVSFGLFIFFGFAVVTMLYLVVMSGTSDVFGTVRVDSQIASLIETSPGWEDTEMVSANGYCIKGPDTDNRMLLSTKNKIKVGKMKYAFAAKEGMRHLIVIYIQMDHLKGDPPQNIEMQFMTNIIKKSDLERDFTINFAEKNGINRIRITVTGEDMGAPLVFEYPMSEIPKIIKL